MSTKITCWLLTKGTPTGYEPEAYTFDDYHEHSAYNDETEFYKREWEVQAKLQKGSQEDRIKALRRFLIDEGCVIVENETPKPYGSAKLAWIEGDQITKVLQSYNPVGIGDGYIVAGSECDKLIKSVMADLDIDPWEGDDLVLKHDEKVHQALLKDIDLQKSPLPLYVLHGKGELFEVNVLPVDIDPENIDVEELYRKGLIAFLSQLDQTLTVTLVKFNL